MNLPAGKVPPRLLRQFLCGMPPAPSSVVVGAALGEDAAVLDLGGDELLVAASDPITFASERIGRDLLAVNENDLVTAGARPRWLLVTLLLPEGIEIGEAERLMDDLAIAAREHEVALVGGHTEVTIGLDRPVAVGCLLGTVPRDRGVTTSGAQIGDMVILVGGIALEGTAILADEHASKLRAHGVEAETIARAAALRHKPGISVRRPVEVLIDDHQSVHAMHDPTEGGLATALHELAEAAQVGLVIDRVAIDVHPECAVICDALGLDPLGLLASGSLLATLQPSSTSHALDRLAAAGLDAARIGVVVDRTAGVMLRTRGRVDPLPVFERDEIVRLLESM